MEASGTDGSTNEAVVLAVGPGDTERECLITWATVSPHVRYRVTATVADDPLVEAEAADLFDALRNVRSQLESRDVALCCAGARRDVWSSGMQRDMGQGLTAYILTFPRTTERPSVVKIFDRAPLEAIATVAEQEAFARAWMESPLDR